MFKSLSLQKNKLVMLVLAMVLTLAMVVIPGINNVVKAATPVDVTVSFLENGAAIDPSMSNIAITVDNTVIPSPATGYPNLGTPTAFDATILAYYNVMGSQILDGMVYGYDASPAYGNPGYWVSYLFDTPTNEVETNYSTTPGASYWHGYTWVLSVNGVESSAYASNLVLNDNDSIVWDYKYVETVW